MKSYFAIMMFLTVVSHSVAEFKPTKTADSKPSASKTLSTPSGNVGSIEMAIKDMAYSWPDRFQDSDKLLEELKGITDAKERDAFQKRVLLRNPLLDFDKLLIVRDAEGNRFPANWQSNSSLSKNGYLNDLAVISIKAPDKIETLYRPDKKAFIGDVDLHFNADKLLVTVHGV